MVIHVIMYHYIRNNEDYEYVGGQNRLDRCNGGETRGNYAYFITDNYPPEYNAAAIRTSEHINRWAETNNNITVITCFPL